MCDNIWNSPHRPSLHGLKGTRPALRKFAPESSENGSGLLNTEEYSERLSELAQRRHQADMAMVHKILCGRGSLDSSQWFERAPDSVRVTGAQQLLST
jgi:hypothetical protein